MMPRGRRSHRRARYRPGCRAGGASTGRVLLEGFVQRDVAGLDLCFCFKFPFYLFWLCWVLVVACGVEVTDQGWNPSPLHWEYRAEPLDHQGSPYVLKARCGCCSEMRLQGGKGRSRAMCQETIMRERGWWLVPG